MSADTNLANDEMDQSRVTMVIVIDDDDDDELININNNPSTAAKTAKCDPSNQHVSTVY